MQIGIALFLTLNQALGINVDTAPLLCADRITLELRATDTAAGCLENERSLGSTPITKAKKDPVALHPKVKLRFDVAQREASKVGVALYIASGFRSIDRQKFLFERAIKKYGTETEAAKWVLPPYISHHPMGLAIDVNYPNDPTGAAWLEKNGWKFGLCRVFDNEWWHFEATTAPGSTCPARLPNALALLIER
jgi:hypothetical protein